MNRDSATVFLFTALVFLLSPAVITLLPGRKGDRGLHLETPPYLVWLERSAAFIQELRPLKKIHLSSDSNIISFAQKLDPSVRKEDFLKLHLRRKIMLAYGLLLSSMLFILLLNIGISPRVLVDGRLEREAEQGSTVSYEVIASLEGNREELSIEVAPREYTQSMWEKKLGEVKAYIDRELPGENGSLEDVGRDLKFVSAYPGENISISWECEDYRLIGPEGRLADLENVKLPVKTKVWAIIRYASYEYRYEKEICITRNLITEEESLKKRLADAVKEADEKSRKDSYLSLPESLEGVKIDWNYAEGFSPVYILPLMVLVILVLSIRQDERLKTEVVKRREMLSIDYPVFVHRMVLMLGAGIDVRRSWDMLLKDLEKEKGAGRSYLWREMNYTAMQMRSGVPDTEAFRDFGSRCGLPCYEQFAQLLVQMIKRGRKGIEDMMMAEADRAQKTRAETARRLGETAGTKLLIPMMMLLITVLAIVMAPALNL